VRVETDFPEFVEPTAGADAAKRQDVFCPGHTPAGALTLINVAKLEVIGTVLLDDRAKGAANPWGAAWSADCATLIVTHSGTHEVSIIDFPALLACMMDLPAPLDPLKPENAALSREDIVLSSYLRFFPSRRQRVKLPPSDLGPRAVVIVGHTAYVANYFSDTLSIVDLSTNPVQVESIPLGPPKEMSLVRKGEFYFHDATICFQGWQSCATCHPDRPTPSSGQTGGELNDQLRRSQRRSCSPTKTQNGRFTGSSLIGGGS
jgi:YVTN family beta-propeller protein